MSACSAKGTTRPTARWALVSYSLAVRAVHRPPPSHTPLRSLSPALSQTHIPSICIQLDMPAARSFCVPFLLSLVPLFPRSPSGSAGTQTPGRVCFLERVRCSVRDRPVESGLSGRAKTVAPHVSCTQSPWLLRSRRSRPAPAHVFHPSRKTASALRTAYATVHFMCHSQSTSVRTSRAPRSWPPPIDMQHRTSHSMSSQNAGSGTRSVQFIFGLGSKSAHRWSFPYSAMFACCRPSCNCQYKASPSSWHPDWGQCLLAEKDIPVSPLASR